MSDRRKEEEPIAADILTVSQAFYLDSSTTKSINNYDYILYQ